MEMTSKTVLTKVPAIERLREQAKASTSRIDLASVRCVVDGIIAGLPLDAVARGTSFVETQRLDDDGNAKTLTPAEQVMDLVAELGTWLVHVHGTKKVAYSVAAECEQLSLFALPETSTPVASKRSKKAKKPKVVIPLGFERKAWHKRDVTNSIIAIVLNQPDDEELSRWLDRKYRSDVGVLSGKDVHTLWLLAQIGRIEDVDKMSKEPAFAQVMVAAFDLLDVSLTDAVGGLSTLYEMGKHKIPLNVERAQRAATMAVWLHEARLSQVINLAQAAANDRSGETYLLHELERLASYIEGHRSIRPLKLESLSGGQVQRLVERAGLGRQEDERKLEAEIRRKLTEMGLRKDMDRLLPMGMRALNVGLESTFWSAIEARRSGDPDWRYDLDEAMAGR